MKVLSEFSRVLLVFLVVSGLYTPFVFVYEKAITEVGVSTNKASLILSLLGIFNTIGRLIAGWLADRPWADSLVIYNVSAILAGLLTCLVSIIFSFELLCVYAAVFGILIGLYHSHRTHARTYGQTDARIEPKHYPPDTLREVEA